MAQLRQQTGLQRRAGLIRVLVPHPDHNRPQSPTAASRPSENGPESTPTTANLRPITLVAPSRGTARPIEAAHGQALLHGGVNGCNINDTYHQRREPSAGRCTMARVQQPAPTGSYRGAQDSRRSRLLYMLGLSLPVVAFEPAPFDILLAALIVLAILRSRRLPRPIYVALACVYIAGGYASLLFARGSGVLDGVATRYLSIELLLTLGLLALFTAVRGATQRQEDLISGYVHGALTIAALTLIVWQLMPDQHWIYRDSTLTRLKGTFQDPNVLGPYLVFPLLVMSQRDLATRFAGRVFRWAVVRMSGVFVLGLLLYLTYSRGAYAAAAVTLCWFGIARTMRAEASGAKSLLVFVAVLAIGTGVALVGPVADERRSGDSRLGLQTYDETRFALLSESLDVSLSNPFGIGPGEFGATRGSNPHNLFLGKATDSGLLPAILVTGALIASTLRSARIGWRRRQALPQLLGATLAGHLVVSSVIYSHHWRHLAVLMALAFALPNRPGRSPPSSPVSEGRPTQRVGRSRAQYDGSP